MVQMHRLSEYNYAILLFSILSCVDGEPTLVQQLSIKIKSKS